MAGGMPPRGGLPGGSGGMESPQGLAGSSPRASIELSGLTKRFGEIAVDNIDLTVASGEFFSLLGPSGCGKTTTLRLIAGFEQPTSGKILLDGVDVSDVPPHRRNVNTVFQSYALFPFLDVFDNVAFGLRHRGVGKADLKRRVDEGSGPGQDDLVRQAAAGSAVRRPAAAGRAGPRARAQPRRPAARRAARRARRQAAPLAQGRAEGAAGTHRHHLPLRHPRPGGGADHVRPAGRDERGPDRADRHPAPGLRGARRHLRGRLPRRRQPDGGRRGHRGRGPARSGSGTGR